MKKRGLLIRITSICISIMMLIGMMPVISFATVDSSIEMGTTIGTNGYYNVISRKDWDLVPGAATETELVLNNSTGTRRQVLHVIEVDPSNPDVSIIPGYYNIDKDVTLTSNQQAATLTKMAAYYENELGYNIVGGMNTDLYYAANEPRILVYNGKDMRSGRTTSSILCVYRDDDGVISCEVKAYNADEITADIENGTLLHAVGVSFGMVVKDGALVKKTEERTTASAARSMVGVKEDGTLVICMNDGRGANSSIGLCDYEEGEIMLALGCEWAANCDGGGSSTFLTKRAGEDAFEMRSVPCDGAERATIHGVFVASNVGPTGELDVINIESDYNYFAPGSTYNFGSKAIDTNGYAMDMPADAGWELSDEAFGTIEDGVFVSNGTLGEVEVQVTSGGEVVGSKEITVANPTTLELSSTSTVIPYSTAEKIRQIPLPIVAMIGEEEVYYDLSTFDIELSNDKAGTINNYTFTATTDTSVTDVTITLTYIPENIELNYEIAFGKGSEILWDFEEDTEGFLGQADAIEWQANQGIETPLASIIAAGNISQDVSSKSFVATEENGGQVHNGNSSLGMEFDMRYVNFNSWVYSNIYNVSNTDGSGVLRDVANDKLATTLGAWVYIPEGFYTEKNSGAIAIRGDFVAGSSESAAVRTNFDAKYNGKTINSLTESDIPENRWIYITFDLSNYNYVSINNSLSTDNYSPCFARMYVKPSVAQKLTYYFDDFTLDYSSAVDDRNPPIISEPTYCTADTNIEMDGQTITTNVVSFNANVADYAATNAEGLDYSSAEIYLDGFALDGVSASGSVMSVENVELSNGTHTIMFKIADKLGNSTTLAKTLTVDCDDANSAMSLSGHNDSDVAPEAGSIYYIDVVADAIEDINSATMTIELQTASTWQLDNMVAAEGFEATYALNKAEPEFATISISKTGENNTTGKQTILSVPVRVWSWDETWTGSGGFTPITSAKAYSSNGEPVLKVEADVVASTIVYADKSTGSFTDSLSVETKVKGDKSNGAWHTHSVEAIDDVDATCTTDGYSSRTYCDDCASVIDWGTTVEATGHRYDFVEDVLTCSCGKLFTGTWTDGKEYVDGVIANSTDGWVDSYYYKDGVKLTGVQKVPAPDGEDEYYYNFGDDGINQGKYTGLFTNDNGTYYTIVGNAVTGWQYIDNAYYYFDPTTYAAVDGKQKLTDGYTYTFENNILVRGALDTQSSAGYIRYRWAGQWARATWHTIDGYQYFFNQNTAAAVGTTFIRVSNERPTWYEFDEKGRLIAPVTSTGLMYLGENTYYVKDGLSQNGLILAEDGYYYYFSSSDYAAVKNTTYSVSHNNGHPYSGNQKFDEQGRMIIDDTPPELEPSTGEIVTEDGVMYYYENGVKTYAGLIYLDGYYYYVNSSKKVVTGSYYVSKHNGMTQYAGVQKFDSQGRMIIESDPEPTEAPEVTGAPEPTEVPEATEVPEIIREIRTEDGTMYYYENGVKKYAGLIYWDGYYYYVNSSKKVVTGSYYVSKYNEYKEYEGPQKFDSQGRMIIEGEEPEPTEAPEVTTAPEPTEVPEIIREIRTEDGTMYYYENGVKKYAGLIYWDGYYYYVNSSKKVVTGSYYVSKYNEYKKYEGSQRFDSQGRMIIEEEEEATPTPTPEDPTLNGIVKDADGTMYYYVDGVKKYAGLIYIDGYYYYVNSSKKVVTGSYYVSKHNGLKEYEGPQKFDSEGRMIISE